MTRRGEGGTISQTAVEIGRFNVERPGGEARVIGPLYIGTKMDFNIVRNTFATNLLGYATHRVKI